MPGTEGQAQLLQSAPLEIKLIVGGVVLVITLTVILLVRRKYWQTGQLSRRQKQKRERARSRVALVTACLLDIFAALFLAIFIDFAWAAFFVPASFLVIVLVFAAAGREDRSVPWDASGGY
jgi:fatty acid desaturase